MKTLGQTLREIGCEAARKAEPDWEFKAWSGISPAAQTGWRAVEDYVRENFQRDVERMDWLCQCTAGEWIELQNVRLRNKRGYLRAAIDEMIQAQQTERKEPPK